MFAVPSAPLWHSLLATSAVAGAFGLALLAVPTYSNPDSPSEDEAIRPFQVNVPEEALVDLRRRIAQTRWPDKETVADQSQGAQLAKLQQLVRYWGTGYDWRKAEKSPTQDDVLDNITLYWLMNTATSSARLYWENGGRNVLSAAAHN